MVEIKTDDSASGVLDQDWTDGFTCIFSLHATWEDLDSPSSIQWTQFKRNNSHICIS